MELEIEAVSANINAGEEDSYSIKFPDGTRIEIYSKYLPDGPDESVPMISIRFGAREIEVWKDEKNAFHVKASPSGNTLIE